MTRGKNNISAIFKGAIPIQQLLHWDISLTEIFSICTTTCTHPIIHYFCDPQLFHDFYMDTQHSPYTCGFVLTCMQTEEFEMHASTKIIVVTGFTTELHAGRQTGSFLNPITFPFNYLR